jgi:hypothetical protein
MRRCQSQSALPLTNSHRLPVLCSFLRKTDSDVAVVVLNCATTPASITVDLSRCANERGRCDCHNAKALCFETITGGLRLLMQ